MGPNQGPNWPGSSEMSVTLESPGRFTKGAWECHNICMHIYVCRYLRVCMCAYIYICVVYMCVYSFRVHIFSYSTYIHARDVAVVSSPLTVAIHRPGSKSWLQCMYTRMCSSIYMCIYILTCMYIYIHRYAYVHTLLHLVCLTLCILTHTCCVNICAFYNIQPKHTDATLCVYVYAYIYRCTD